MLFLNHVATCQFTARQRGEQLPELGTRPYLRHYSCAMNARNLLLAAVLFLVVGLISLGSKWNGNAGFNVADSVNARSVTFNGSVHGWPALIDIVAIVIAIVAAVIGLIRVLMD